MNKRTGQVLIETALVLPLLLTLAAFFADLGIGQWRKIEAQTIANAAATASVVSALQTDLQCGYGVVCATATCPTASGNLQAGCQAAAPGSSATFKTQTSLSAGSGAPTGVTDPTIQYFVTSRVSEVIFPIFSSGLHVNVIATAVLWQNGANRGVYLIQ